MIPPAFKGDWNIVTGKLKQRWARLTDNDLPFVKGKEEAGMGRIQARTGARLLVIERILQEVMADHNRN